ncbi:serine/threonine-protein kinase [Lignipirellula cremea]|uniref:serine/threonine-protein kinase n=1 Tax=Lignipirellula cremea TaxID=2528010 RepID=UPI0018D2150B|nr:serine/threonine-protein kinase [Lignipirellula cremea]
MTGLLGEGQWTRVFLARPQGMPAGAPSDYAVKLQRPERVDDRQAIALFAHEAKVGRAASHPNLVAILAAQIDKPPRYLVMPRLEGATARTLVRRGPLTAPLALWIARQTMQALTALHEQQWLHGDVKPENIFVARSGHVTLLDLGFSRKLGVRNDESLLAGTLRYMAPELFVGLDPIGRASDIYSLGVTLFELLTGAPPFTDKGDQEIALAHLRRPAPSPLKTAPHLGPRICHLLREMLAKEPLRRPSSEELVERLLALEIETFGERWPAA